MSKLDVAEDQSWLSAFGVLPETEEASADDYVREVNVPATDLEAVQVAWDVTDSSVRVRHHRGGRIVVDLHREMATLLTLSERGWWLGIHSKRHGRD